MHLYLFLTTLIIHQVFSLFDTTPKYKFNITSISNPTRLALSQSSNKFIVWNNQSAFAVHYTNGTNICQKNINYPIQKIIWPSNYQPIILPFPGQNIIILNSTYCQISKSINVNASVNISAEISQISFTWRNGVPILAMTSFVSIIQLNLNKSKDEYLYIDGFDYHNYHQTTYSNDGKYLYASKINYTTGVRNLNIFNTAPSIIALRTINFGNKSITGLTTMRDNISIVCFGYSFTTPTLTIYKFDNSGSLKSIVDKTNITKAIGVGQGNTALLFKKGSSSFQLVRIGDGKTIQNTNYFSAGSLSIYDAVYNSKTLMMIDNIGTVVVSTYQPDADPQPTPDVINQQGFPVWAIIVIIIVGLLILIGIVIVFRKKMKKAQPMPKQQYQPIIQPILIQKNIFNQSDHNQNNVNIQKKPQFNNVFKHDQLGSNISRKSRKIEGNQSVIKQEPKKQLTDQQKQASNRISINDIIDIRVGYNKKIQQEQIRKKEYNKRIQKERYQKKGDDIKYNTKDPNNIIWRNERQNIEWAKKNGKSQNMRIDDRNNTISPSSSLFNSQRPGQYYNNYGSNSYNIYNSNGNSNRNNISQFNNYTNFTNTQSNRYEQKYKYEEGYKNENLGFVQRKTQKPQNNNPNQTNYTKYQQKNNGSQSNQYYKFKQ